MVKARHALLARMHGAATGVPGAVAAGPGAAAAFVPDLVSLAWLQARMVVHIAAVYGHDTADKEMVGDILLLQGFYNTTEAARAAVTQGTTRVATRAVKARLQGPTLVALKAQFKRVHINFTRVWLLKAIPLVAIPLGAAVNEASTRSLARRAIKYYDTKPRRR